MTTEEPTTTVDEKNQLKISYPKRFWDRDDAQEDFSVGHPLFKNDAYQENVAWKPAHTSTEWAWYQLRS